MKRMLLLTGMAVIGAGAAEAGSFGKPCTSEPQARWKTIEEIETVVAERGYSVAKSKFKSACAEIYARDKDGKRVELFVDPATGTILGVQ